jgi:hypothetical protein
MLLELSKAFSFLVSLMSLYFVFWNSFFIPGSRWEERVWLACSSVGFAGCVCFMSGIVFRWPSAENPERDCPLLSTLPVRVFLWALVGMVVLFVSSWYLDVYYVPQLWKNLP